MEPEEAAVAVQEEAEAAEEEVREAPVLVPQAVLEEAPVHQAVSGAVRDRQAVMEEDTDHTDLHTHTVRCITDLHRDAADISDAAAYLLLSYRFL